LLDSTIINKLVFTHKISLKDSLQKYIKNIINLVNNIKFFALAYYRLIQILIMKNSVLQKLTLIIISYNRHELLIRAIKYWSNFDIKVVVIDGSEVRLKNSYSNYKNIRYIHDQRSLNDRLLNSFSYIDTEFMILACDDEFYLPSALSSCINFLSIEPSFSCCGGRAVGFRTKEKKILGIRQYPKLRGLCLDHDSATDRVSKHFSDYVPAHFFSVIRANKWKTICSYTFQKKNSFLYSSELQMEFLTVVSGKSKVISELMWMRNNDVLRIDSRSDIPIEEWWYDKKYEIEKVLFLQRTKKGCNELSTNQNLQLNEDTISKLFEVHIKKILEHNNKNLFRKMLNLVSNKVAIKLLKFVKNFFSIAAGEKSLTEEINILKAEGVLVNHEELKQIISILHNSKNEDQNQ